MDENLVESMQMDETTDPKLWLMSLCTTLSQRDFIQVLVTLWSIWWARRRAIHEEEFQSPLSTRLFIKRYLDELEWTPQSDKTTRGIIKPASSAWIRPPAGCMKLNVDGAVAKSTAKGAVGVVCRNDQGIFVGASAVVFAGVTDPMTLESYACREGLDLANDLNIQRLAISSDCQAVVNDINSSSLSGKNGMILRDIVQNRSKFLVSVFGYERREANGEAHRLARMATTLDIGRHVWLNDPPDHLCIPLNITIQ
jgi:ribonuclease HI